MEKKSIKEDTTKEETKEEGIDLFQQKAKKISMTYKDLDGEKVRRYNILDFKYLKDVFSKLIDKFTNNKDL